LAIGQGDVLRNRPRIAGQHYGYLLRQLQETASNQRPGMDLAHVDMLKELHADELSGVADYLSRLSPDLSSIKDR
jgi:cytochrome c553